MLAFMPISTHDLGCVSHDLGSFRKIMPWYYCGRVFLTMTNGNPPFRRWTCRLGAESFSGKAPGSADLQGLRPDAADPGDQKSDLAKKGSKNSFWHIWGFGASGLRKAPTT